MRDIAVGAMWMALLLGFVFLVLRDLPAVLICCTTSLALNVSLRRKRA